MENTPPTEPLWCGTCPKCAFVFLLLSAHLPLETVVSIFKKNLFADPTLTSLFRQLLGWEGTKPFECVGTPTEVRKAFSMACARNPSSALPILEMFSSTSLAT